MSADYNIESIFDRLYKDDDNDTIDRVFINDIPKIERIEFMTALLDSDYFEGRVGNETAWRNEISDKEDSSYLQAEIVSITIEKRTFENGRFSFFFDTFNRGENEYGAFTFTFNDIVGSRVGVSCNVCDISIFLGGAK